MKNIDHVQTALDYCQKVSQVHIVPCIQDTMQLLHSILNEKRLDFLINIMFKLRNLKKYIQGNICK